MELAGKIKTVYLTNEKDGKDCFLCHTSVSGILASKEDITKKYYTDKKNGKYSYSLTL